MWVSRVRTCFAENQMLPMVMPEPRVEVGAVLAYKHSETGETACGCVERMRGRVVRVRLLELARRRTRAAGSGQVGRRMAMHAEGGAVAELDLAKQKWVRVDTAETGDVSRAAAWMQRGCQRADFEVTLVSAADHIDMRRCYVKRLRWRRWVSACRTRMYADCGRNWREWAVASGNSHSRGNGTCS